MYTYWDFGSTAVEERVLCARPSGQTEVFGQTELRSKATV